jgi:glycosyltransferase involved in cell wall biosynthesis
MISVTILTKNSARHLFKVLDSVRQFDEVVILDSGSTDETLAIARRFPNVTIHSTQFRGFGTLHNEASALARNDWIFSLDSDEVLTPGLVQEVAGLSLDANTVYSVNMRNYFNGKLIRWSGWYPDRHVRLFNRKKTRFTEDEVHERVIVNGFREIALTGPVQHYSFSCVADFLTKTQLYSDLYAQQYQGKKKSSMSKVIGHAVGAFLKSFLLKRGFLDGREGFIISVSNSQATYYKYLKLLEANEKEGFFDVADFDVSPSRRPSFGRRQSTSRSPIPLRVPAPPV